MKIAVPVNDTLTLYKDNPHTAPRFAIYDVVTTSGADVYFSLHSVIENTLFKIKNAEFDTTEIKCDCDIDRQKNLRHKCDHYAILELIGECSYLLASKYCKNTKISMKQGGIEVFKIPSIINTVNIAIKNFIIGGSFANKIKHIHHAS
jgi:predicted Fe-Mo cluster-binding NifX family protein